MKDLICYCFGYSVDNIIQDYLDNDKSTIVGKIQTEKKFGNCQCATKNPKGKGCLGDVRRVVDKLKGKPSLNVIGGSVYNRKVYRLNNHTESNIFTLDDSIDPLVEQFNSNNSRIRSLALLSPI